MSCWLLYFDTSFRFLSIFTPLIEIDVQNKLVQKSGVDFGALRLFPEELVSDTDEQTGVEFGFGDLDIGLFDMLVTG